MVGELAFGPGDVHANWEVAWLVLKECNWHGYNSPFPNRPATFQLACTSRAPCLDFLAFDRRLKLSRIGRSERIASSRDEQVPIYSSSRGDHAASQPAGPWKPIISQKQERAARGSCLQRSNESPSAGLGSFFVVLVTAKQRPARLSNMLVGAK